MLLSFLSPQICQFASIPVSLVNLNFILNSCTRSQLNSLKNQNQNQTKSTTTTQENNQKQTVALVTLKNKDVVIPGWLSGLAPAFSPGDGPGVLGLSPALGSLQGACFLLYLPLPLSLSVSHE